MAGVYALQYAPKGGTLLFKDSVISSDTVYTEYIGNVSYIPVAELSAYLIDYVDTTFIGQLKSMALSEGLAAAAAYGAKKFTEKTGLSIKVAVVTAIIELEQWYIQYAEYNVLKNAYQTYCEGIETGGLITTTKYIHNKVTGTGNITTTYARWGGTYIQTVHSGKTGTFYAGQYYAGGEWF